MVLPRSNQPFFVMMSDIRAVGVDGLSLIHISSSPYFTLKYLSCRYDFRIRYSEYFFKFVKEAHVPNPVSYTHLDVYKRQT